MKECRLDTLSCKHPDSKMLAVCQQYAGRFDHDFAADSELLFLH